MKTEKPFIKLLRSPNSGYFFDVNKNEIIAVDDDVFNYLNCVMNNRYLNADKVTLEKVKKLEKCGYLSSNKVKVLKHPNSDFVEKYLNGHLSRICLQVTQNCNLRCSYCVYSGSKDGKQRTHAIKKMTIETAQKALEFYAEHSRYSETAAIGFYGGEPLLEFDLIKAIVEMSEKMFEGKKVNFNVTTNATLLTDPVVKYLSEHNISCMISLDGPKEIHDLNRVFANSDKGSFEKLYSNVENVSLTYPEYFNDLSISMVMDPANDFELINSIFSKGSIFEKMDVQPTLIDNTYLDRNSVHLEGFSSKIAYHNFLTLLCEAGRCEKEDISPITYRNIIRIQDMKYNMSKSTALPECAAPGGPCIAGYTRLFCNVEGSLFPCERVSENSNVMNIGTIQTGFDIEKIKKIMNVSQITSEQCKNCWAFSHCTQCAKLADDGDNLNAEMRLSNCASVKHSLEMSFMYLILLREIKSIYNRNNLYLFDKRSELIG